MFAKTYNLPYNDDLFNLNHNRTIKNTPRSMFNCGGYALNTFSWYQPGEDCNMWYYYDSSNMEDYTDYCIDVMLEDFDDLRVINDLSEIRSNEYAIAFRLSSNGDFHYIKRDKTHHWRHKRGCCATIMTMTEYEVLNTFWCGIYDGPLVLFAKKY